MSAPARIHAVADPTEPFRRRRIAEPFRRRRIAELIPGVDRAELERRHGRVWGLRELAADFIVVGFMAPYVVVRRKSDGVVGSLEFQHEPRLYFNWREDR